MKIQPHAVLSCFVTSIVLAFSSSPVYASNIHFPSNWVAHPPIHIKPGVNGRLPSGLSPSQVLKAYGFPANLQGSGQTIAIIDAFDDPNIESDLLTFSSTFGLPVCSTANGCFKKIYSTGSQPTGDTGWGEEMSLDVEWVHAIAPAAHIILIETPDASSSLYSAIAVALANNATVISCSWGGAEFSGETTQDSVFQASTVPVVASSGDNGDGVSYPAASPYVLSVGGTSLALNADSSYASETAWTGSGGGISAYETEPNYQVNFGIPQDSGVKRGVPDVSYHADPNNGFSVYDSYGQSGWMVVGGTSAGAPQWAAMIAIANSAAGKNLAAANMPLYTAALSSYSTLYHNIVTGTNGSCGYYCQARTGFDYVTGLGSPKATALISALTSGTQILQLTNSLYNSEASAPGITPTSATFQFYTGSSVLCDTRTIAYGATVTIQPGVTGSSTGHTTCTSSQNINNVTATPAVANAVVGGIFGTSPVSYSVTSTSGITQIALQLKPAGGSDYAPVFDATNGTVKTPGTANLTGS